MVKHLGARRGSGAPCRAPPKSAPTAVCRSLARTQAWSGTTPSSHPPFEQKTGKSPRAGRRTPCSGSSGGDRMGARRRPAVRRGAVRRRRQAVPKVARDRHAGPRRCPGPQAGHHGRVAQGRRRWPSPGSSGPSPIGRTACPVRVDRQWNSEGPAAKHQARMPRHNWPKVVGAVGFELTTPSSQSWPRA